MNNLVSNPLYLFGILEESIEFQTWKKNAPREYKIYRDEWMKRSKNGDYGQYPLSLNIEITRRCNLACTFCWHNELASDLQIDMTFEMFKKIIDESKKFNLPAVNLNGLGEPMLHPELIAMIRYCKDAGVQEVMFHTNATIMTKSLAKDLIESGLDMIIFSLDSPDKKTYEAMRIKASFDAVQKNVNLFLDVKKHLSASKPFVRATMVLTENTTEQVSEFIDTWSGKVDSITVQDLLFAANSDVGSDDNNKFKGTEKSRINITKNQILKYYEKNDLKFICPYLFQSLKIHPSGKVSACSPQEAPELGDLSNTIHSVWNGNLINEIRHYHLKGDWFKVPECSRCDVPYMELARHIEHNKD